MNYKLADRVHKVLPSFTLQMATRAAEMRSAGIDVINFSVGEPDFNTPSHIINAGKKAMDDGFTKYTAGPGMVEFRKAICQKLERENGITYEPADILVSNGEKQSLYNVCQALFGEGDEVIVFRPYWVSFPEFVRLADAEPVLVDTIAENNFEPDFEDLTSKASPNVKGIILNSPSNPTGGIWGEKAILKVLHLAKEHGWVIISDECYERLVYDGEFVSTEKLNREHNIGATVITCLSLSKTYAMTGWRIGYAAGPRDIIKAMSKIQGQATSCANSIGQMAGIEALTGDQSCVDKFKEAFRERRDLMVQLLNELPGITCAVPGGAFYAFPKVIGTGMNGSEFCKKAMHEAGVAIVPGTAFGKTCSDYVRFSFAASRDNISQALENIKKMLTK